MRVRCDANPFIPRMWLFHDKEKYLRWARKHGDREDPPTFADALALYDDGCAAVLVESTELDGTSHEDVMALIVHEAYHVASDHWAALGEHSPGEEVMAYTIQVIAFALFHAHAEWLGGKAAG